MQKKTKLCMVHIAFVLTYVDRRTVKALNVCLLVFFFVKSCYCLQFIC